MSVNVFIIRIVLFHSGVLQRGFTQNLKKERVKNGKSKKKEEEGNVPRMQQARPIEWRGSYKVSFKG